MLRIRSNAPADGVWREVRPDDTLDGLFEDTDYQMEGSQSIVELVVDDEVLQPDTAGRYLWRPAFYAGSVIVETRSTDATRGRYRLDISPNPSKSGQDQFDEMVRAIRHADPSLLLGTSPALLDFGDGAMHASRKLDVLLQRVRLFGPDFLAAVDAIGRSPHRALTANLHALPLARARRVHHSALRSGRVVQAIAGMRRGFAEPGNLLVAGVEPRLTFDSPANRALLALVRRFTAVVGLLTDAVSNQQLCGDKDDQRVRATARLRALAELAAQARLVLSAPTFEDLASAETSSAGLTQIAAHPDYSRAYRLGNKALSSHIGGQDADSSLHIPPSWGIYETWCYLQTVQAVSQLTDLEPVERPPRRMTADRCSAFALADGRELEVLFQAVFPSPLRTHAGFARSLSRERRPDIVLLLHGPGRTRCLVLDAKWRSKVPNILDAMESAHIYHDALRVENAPPERCVLLLPGNSEVHHLCEPAFMEEHGVGTIAAMRTEGSGRDHMLEVIGKWLHLGRGETSVSPSL